MLLHPIYVNNIQLCTPFPYFSHLEAATTVKGKKPPNDNLQQGLRQ